MCLLPTATCRHPRPPRSGATQRVQFVQPDHLGSPRVVIDAASNTPVWTWELTGEAFGATSPNQDPDGDGQPFVLNMRFPGQRYDAATGLNYNYFRDYEPNSGRYVQSDPIGLGADISLHSYGFSNPLIATDYYGLASVPSKNFSPGRGGNSADRRKVTRDYLHAFPSQMPPSYRLPPVEADAYTLPSSSGGLTPYEGTCRQLEAFGLDLCGPGPKIDIRCIQYECKNPRDICTRFDQSGWSRGPFMVPTGYSFENDPNCRCVRRKLIDKW